MIITPDHQITREHMNKIRQLALENYENHISQCGICEKYEAQDGSDAYFIDECEEGDRLSRICGKWLGKGLEVNKISIDKVLRDLEWYFHYIHWDNLPKDLDLS